MTWRIPLADVRITAAQRAAVDEVLATGWLSMGPRTAEFEQAFASAAGVHHAIAVTNASAGLVLALQAVGVGPGDEVILPSLTFVADANSIVALGARPVFADIESPARPVLDPHAALALVGPRTRAVLTVHYAGYLAATAPLAALRDRGIALVEDAAHAVGGADEDGHWQALTGDAAVYSFFANKNLPLGEGGMVTTRDGELAAQGRLLRSHGMTALTWDRHLGRATDYDVLRPGWNFRPTEMGSALGTAGLPHLDAHNTTRRTLLDQYRARLSGSAASMIFEAGTPTTAHLAVVVLPADDRDRVRAALRDAQIETSFHYPPIHHFAAYKAGEQTKGLDQTDTAARQLLTLPLHPWLTPTDVDACDVLLGALEARS